MKRFINYLMPRFFEDMPANKPGQWRAVVIVYNFRKSEEVWSRSFKGLRRAYVAARLMALWNDLMQPLGRGINWAVAAIS